MLLLVERRHQSEIVEEVFLKRLSHLLLEQTNKNSATDKTKRVAAAKDWKHNSKTNEMFSKYVVMEDFLLENIMSVYYKILLKIQQITDLRGKTISKIISDFEKEKQIWNKLVLQQSEILKKAER